MDLWRWALVPGDLHISAGSSTYVSVLGDRQQLTVTVITSTIFFFFKPETNSTEI